MTPISHTDLPQPADNDLQKSFWAAVDGGHVAFQRCSNCQHAFLPGREECPSCLEADLVWEEASGKAKLVSWVVYHRAFHPAFADRIPYVVALVELTEGARMITNLVDFENPENFKLDQPLQLKIEIDGSVKVPRFVAIP